jgi:hypothetical protein
MFSIMIPKSVCLKRFSSFKIFNAIFVRPKKAPPAPY